MLRNLMDKCWKSSQSATKILLRAFGLNLVVSGIRSLKRLAVGRGYDEQIKVAIRRSRKVALLRALIHIPPFCIAVWEVALNFNTYYVGTAPLNQAYYQFGAKLHEMTAQASLAAIVFSYVRHELSLGQGLPFGALFSGLQVTQGMEISSLLILHINPSLSRQDVLWEHQVICISVQVLRFCTRTVVLTGRSTQSAIYGPWNSGAQSSPSIFHCLEDLE